MSWRASFFIGIVIFATFIGLGSVSVSRAAPEREVKFASSPLELIDAVNSLRLNYGIAPYNINAILMSTAQAQADFLAATGSMTHSGPGGIGVTERLLAAGYPLAGDLSLGGFRSENITGGKESMSAQDAVEAWTGDSPHLTTMISPNLTEIGAGVAVRGGRVYYVIDCALPTTGGVSRVVSTPVAGGSAVPADEAAVVMPVELSTPNAEGDVVHEIKAGQSLWQIAIAYGVKIDEIRSLNGLSGNDIYPGNTLLIKKGAPVSTASVIAPATQTTTPTATGMPTSTATYDLILTSTAVVFISSTSVTNSAIMKVTMAVIALALVGAGIFTWLGGAQKKTAPSK